MTKTFQDIIAWQKAHIFVLSVYKYCKTFPPEEKYGLWSQFTRAAVSIAANIAEGYKKISKLDKIRFFNISQGSLEECRYYIILSKDLGYITLDQYNDLKQKLDNASVYLNTYINAIINNKVITD